MADVNIFTLAKDFDSLKLNELNLDELTDDEIYSYGTLASKYKEFEKYNQLAFWKPHPFQLQWIEASNHYRQRYLSAANRIGKTYGACMELAAHITGLYPEWWNGRKIKDSGHEFWVVGVSQESVNNVLMKELIGVSDARNLSAIGTGAIPKENINIFSMDKDGARCKKVRIKHADGGFNTLSFFASTQEESVFMGATVKYALMDEQFKTEADLYGQLVTRTATTEGMISVTCTPELGASELWLKFNGDDSGFLYFQSATWDDAPHLTEDAKAQLLAGFPAYQRDMRSKGIPVIGEGAVYPFSEDEIKAELSIATIKANPFNYKLMWGCDFGYSSNESADPSTLILTAYELETDKIFVVSEWNSKQDVKANRLAHMPEHMASVIKASPFPYAPLIVPHDGAKQIDGAGTNTTRLAEFKRLGINVIPTVFEIPSQLTQGAYEKPKHSRSLHWTIGYLCKLFSDDKLKLITNKLPELMSEYRVYQYKENGNPRDSKNHLLDAMRLAVVTVKHKGIYAGQCYGKGIKGKWETGQRINKAFSSRTF